MTDPLAPLLDAIAERVAVVVARQSAITESRPGLDHFRPYTYAEAAKYLGVKKDTIGDIPECALPRVRPNGGHPRILGINLLLYGMGQPPVDTDPIAEAERERFLAAARPPRPVRSIGPATAPPSRSAARMTTPPPKSVQVA